MASRKGCVCVLAHIHVCTLGQTWQSCLRPYVLAPFAGVGGAEFTLTAIEIQEFWIAQNSSLGAQLSALSTAYYSDHYNKQAGI